MALPIAIGLLSCDVHSIVPIYIVGIEPQADTWEGVVLQVEVTNCESLGNCGCRVVRTVTCLVGSDRCGTCGTDLNGFSIALYLGHQAVGTGEGNIQTRACHRSGDEVEITHGFFRDHIKRNRLVGFIEGRCGGEGWGRGVGAITRLSRSQGDGTGGLDLQSVEVPVSISIELADEGGVHLPVVESHIIDLTVEISTATGTVPTDNDIARGVRVNCGSA